VTLEEFLRQMGSTHGLLATLGVTFLAGIVASAVCPCTLPVGLGVASVAGASEVRARRHGLQVAVAFFAGIVINLTVLGALAGRLGALATDAFGRCWALAMAVLSLVAAAVALSAPRLKAPKLVALRRPGLLGAIGYGFVFSLGTSVAPLLLLITVSAANRRPEYGFVLALTFGLGRGTPFLLAGLIGTAITRFTLVGQWRRGLEIASGLVLLVVSAYYAKTFVALL